MPSSVQVKSSPRDSLKLIHRGTLPDSSPSKSDTPTCLTVALVPHTHLTEGNCSGIVALISGHTGGGIIIWTIRPSVVSSPSLVSIERVLRSCPAHKGPVTAVLLGSDIFHTAVEPGFWVTIFTASIDGTIKQWHFDLMKTGIPDTAVVRTIYCSSCSITCIARFPSLRNKYLVSGSSDGSVALWTAEREVAESKVSSVLLYPPYEHAGCVMKGSREGTSWVTGVAVLDGEIPAIISGDSSGWIKTFQLNSDMKGAEIWKKTRVCEASIRKLLLVSSTDCSSVGAEDLILVLCGSYRVTGLDLTTLERLFTFDIPYHHDISSARTPPPSTPHNAVSCVMAWSGPKSRLVLGASLDGLSVYDTSKSCGIDCGFEDGSSLGPLAEAVFSPCGCSLFTIHALKREISVYSVVATQRYARLGEGSISKPDFSDNPASVIYLSTIDLTLSLKETSCLVVGNSHGDVRLWDMEEPFDGGRNAKGSSAIGQLVFILDAAVHLNCRGGQHLVEVTAMMYVPCCQCVACGMEDGTVFLMPVKPLVNSQCQYLKRGVKAHRNTVTSFCVIREEVLVCGSYDGTVSFWRISPPTPAAAMIVKYEGSIDMPVVYGQVELVDDFKKEHLEEVLSLAATSDADDDDQLLFVGGSSGSIMQYRYSGCVEDAAAVPKRIEYCIDESIVTLQSCVDDAGVLYAVTSSMKVGEWSKSHTVNMLVGIDNTIDRPIATVATVLVGAREGSDVLVATGDDAGMVNFLRLRQMKDASSPTQTGPVAIRKTFTVESAISSLAFSSDQTVIYVGTAEGEVILLPFST
ncbi:hypothetical protein FOL47_010273 [Perkinsus chesapeaki]|uniref:Uncharacterized protein n=1 Tax=Perkinsus chesapeaki TaxID=330153 RepID=A0A7J6L2Z3_PERCH|nr:hypothetical protein FOL47_010273 [Perkinsus chesapeaki]